MQRTIAIGDIHGCLDEFVELVNLVGFEKRTDRLVLLGDLIDRGPDPAGVVRFAREIGAECVKGNHEEKALRWRKHEKRRQEEPDKYKNPMLAINERRLAQWAAIPDEDWDWISSLPCYLHLDDTWTAVHAGVLPDAELEDQKDNELMRVRYVKTITEPSGYNRYKMISPEETGEMPENTRHWTDLWEGPRHIVYGHYTYMAGFYPSPLTLGIDTGCVHGATLTAAIFVANQPGYQIETVRAKKIYAERKPWNDAIE